MRLQKLPIAVHEDSDRRSRRWAGTSRVSWIYRQTPNEDAE